MEHHIKDSPRILGRIRRAAKLLGVRIFPMCHHCKAMTEFFPHEPDCDLRAIDPENLYEAMVASGQKLKRDINRQRVFHSDKPYWNGLPGEKKETLTGKRKRYPHPATREMHWCEVCETSHLFINNKCTVCEHSQECAYLPSGPNCQTCHPGE